MLQASAAPAAGTAAGASSGVGAWASIFRAASDALFDLPPLEVTPSAVATPSQQGVLPQ